MVLVNNHCAVGAHRHLQAVRVEASELRHNLKGCMYLLSPEHVLVGEGMQGYAFYPQAFLASGMFMPSVLNRCQAL